MSDADSYLRQFASNGSAAAFECFVRETARPLNRFLLRILGTGDPGVVEELVQRTYVAAARKAASYRGPSATAWILGFAFREVRSHRREDYRRRAKEVVMPAEHLAHLTDRVEARPPDPAASAERKDEAALLRAELERLDGRFRLPLELVYLEGLSYTDAAAVLSIPTGTVKSRVSRALEALRRRLRSKQAAPSIGIALSDLAEDLGPGLPADLSARAGEWTRTALANASQPHGAPSAVDAGSTATASTAQASTAAYLSAKLWLLAAAIALAAIPVILWRADKENATEERPARRPVASAADERRERNAAGAPAPVREDGEPARDAAPTEPATPPSTTSYFWARGVVKDSNGRPMEGVDLRVTDAWDDLSAFPGDPMQVAEWAGGHSGPARTGPDGRFEVEFTERSRDGTRVYDYEGKARKVHLVHLVAAAPDGRAETVRLRTRPTAPPEVAITFAQPGSIVGKIVPARGTPPLKGAAVTAVLFDSRPGRYDYFVRAELSLWGTFELPDLEPGRWNVRPVHLPDSVSVVSPETPEVEVTSGATVQVVVTVGPSQGLAGRIASPDGFGVEGGTLRLLDVTGSELDRVRLGPTPLGRNAATGEPARKAFMGALDVDISATPTPFRFMAARDGEEYRVALDGPDGVTLETFGPFTAPAANLELRAREFQPDGAALVELRGIDVATARDGVAALFRGTERLGRVGLDHGDGLRRPPSPLAFGGLAAGRYTLEITVKEAWNSYSYHRGSTPFELRPHEQKRVEVEIGESAPVEIAESDELGNLRAKPNSSSRCFSACPLDTRAPPTSAKAIDGQGARSGDGKIRLGLPPGEYALYLPVDPWARSGQTYRFGSLLRLVVKPHVGASVEEPPPSGSRLAVAIGEAHLRGRTLRVEGTTTDGLPVEIPRVEAREGTLEIVDLPAGTYTLTIAGPIAEETRIFRHLQFDGGTQEIDWPPANDG